MPLRGVSGDFGASGVAVLMRVIARLQLAPQKVAEDERLEFWGAGAGTGRVLKTSLMTQTRPKAERFC